MSEDKPMTVGDFEKRIENMITEIRNFEGESIAIGTTFEWGKVSAFQWVRGRLQFMLGFSRGEIKMRKTENE